MKVSVLRERLQRFIETAEEKKLAAIYTLVEDEIMQQNHWEDESFVAEMEERYQDYKTGKSKSVSLEEVEAKARNVAKASKRK